MIKGSGLSRHCHLHASVVRLKQTRSDTFLPYRPVLINVWCRAMRDQQGHTMLKAWLKEVAFFDLYYIVQNYKNYITELRNTETSIQEQKQLCIFWTKPLGDFVSWHVYPPSVFGPCRPLQMWKFNLPPLCFNTGCAKSWNNGPWFSEFLCFVDLWWPCEWGNGGRACVDSHKHGASAFKSSSRCRCSPSQSFERQPKQCHSLESHFWSLCQVP